MHAHYFAKSARIEQQKKTTTQTTGTATPTHALPSAHTICRPRSYTRYLCSIILILNYHMFLSCAMSSVNKRDKTLYII